MATDLETATMPGDPMAKANPHTALDESPAARAYREAEEAADKRVSFYKHLVAYGMIVLFMFIQGGWDAGIVIGLLWGTFLAVRGYTVIWAPEQRARWIKDEMARKAALDERGKSSKRLEDLSASIAHEIRNPITAAKSLLQQMGEDPTSAENVEYAKIALAELDRVERSITHLLRYARDEEVRVEEMRLAEVAESALESFKERLEKKHIAVTRDFDGEGAMRGDPEKLRRVVINLVGNAIDALEDGAVEKPEIVVSMGQDLAGRELWLKVKDNGPGMEAAQIEKIWSPFHTTKTTGTGLGLAITKKLVEAHGGSIEVHSEPGRGAEFALHLPRGEVRT